MNHPYTPVQTAVECGRFEEALTLLPNGSPPALSAYLEYAAGVVNYDRGRCRLAIDTLGKMMGIPAPVLSEMNRVLHDDIVFAACAVGTVAMALFLRNLFRGRMVEAIAHLNPLIEAGLRIAIAVSGSMAREDLLDLKVQLKEGNTHVFLGIINAVSEDDDELAEEAADYKFLGPRHLMRWAQARAATQPHPLSAMLEQWTQFRNLSGLGNRGRHTLGGVTLHEILRAASTDFQSRLESVSDVRSAMHGRVNFLLDVAGVLPPLSASWDLIQSIENNVYALLAPVS